MTLEVPNKAGNRNIRKFICSVLTLCITFLSAASDIFVGTALIIQYYSLGHKSWAVITFSFILFPSVIMHILSIRLHISNRNMSPSHWLLHLLLLGIIHRYISSIRKCVRIYRTKHCLDSNSVKSECHILKNLYLFKSFLECAPQLVLQLYFIAVGHIALPWTGVAAATSAFSIAWALIIHTKKGNDCPGLVFLILWRTGMVTARISALVLCTYTCGPWTVLFIGSHWLAMMLWITYQKAVLDDKDKKVEFHSALYGIIYCVCFVSIKTGQSRSNAIILNLLLLFQNLVFLAIFLLSFSDKSPGLTVVSFVSVTFGSLLGVTSFFVYNIFYHSQGPFKCVTSPKESSCCRRAKGLFKMQTNVFVVQKSENTPENSGLTPESEQLEEIQSPSDSIIIIEESQTPNPIVEDKKLQRKKEESDPIYEEPKPNEIKNETEEGKLLAALKRRAICSSVDLTKFFDTKIENDSESHKSLRGVVPEETPSEVLSTHDYENLCAVNIAREPWGIRSWRVYSDIETHRHDDSVFNERRLDDMTTSSEYSGKVEDSLNSAEDDLLHCEIDANSDKTSVNFVPPCPTNMLQTIYEEYETLSGCVSGIGTKYNSESALVATIDKICLSTPLRSRSGSIDNGSETPEVRRMPDNKIVEDIKGKRELRLENDQKERFSPVRGKIRTVEKFNIFKERYETSWYPGCGNSAAEGCGGEKFGETNKVNLPVASQEKGGNGSKKSFNFKENSSFLVQKLTPSKLEKRMFPITPPKR